MTTAATTTSHTDFARYQGVVQVELLFWDNPIALPRAASVDVGHTDAVYTIGKYPPSDTTCRFSWIGNRRE